VAGELLLVALPALVQSLVALGAGEPAHIEALQDPPDTRIGDLHIVIALQVHRDLGRPEVVVLPQVDDLSHGVDVGAIRAHLRTLGTRFESLLPGFLVATLPGVEGLRGDPVVPAGHGHIAGHFFGMVEDRQATFHGSSDFSGEPLVAGPPE